MYNSMILALQDKIVPANLIIILGLFANFFRAFFTLRAKYPIHQIHIAF
ncbi:hypothetical protein CSC34_0993 [Pseudomonas aeruginosa]|nr:hypothetical protein CSC34_0993 [Pseudomonas aeruginosa]